MPGIFNVPDANFVAVVVGKSVAAAIVIVVELSVSFSISPVPVIVIVIMIVTAFFTVAFTMAFAAFSFVPVFIRKN